jgi:transposase-like protein
MERRKKKEGKEMRLQLLLPKVEAKEIKEAEECEYEGCGGHVQKHQVVKKAIRDTKEEMVQAQRYRCLKCRRTFRVYPKGVSPAQTSDRVKGLAVMLYLLGLSYGAVALALEGLGVPLSKTTVYDTVQATAKKIKDLKREQVFGGVRTPALGADLTSVKCAGKWLHLGLTVDAISGVALTIDQLQAEDAKALKEWLEPIAQSGGAQVLVTDDADGLKTAADELGLEQQICKSHVKRNTEELIDELAPLAAKDADGSLLACGVTLDQAQADLVRLGELIVSRKPEEIAQLAQIHLRYGKAAPPRKGEHASIAYRMRLLFLDRWNLWKRLTRYRLWNNNHQEQQRLDGTNNACERAIGWWIKERYRSMRGYKVPANALRLSRLLAWSGNFLNRGGADLASLIA